MKIGKTIIFLLVVFITSGTFADTPKYSNEFMSIGVSARGLAMSGSQVACVDDATAAFWNPAGLTLIKSNAQVAAMHSEYFAGIAKYDYGTIAVKIDTAHALAFTIIRFGVDDIPNTSELIDASGNFRYDLVTLFAVADYSFMFSYATQSKIPGLRYGASVKVIHCIAGDFATSWGFGLDAGAQYQKGKWLFGAMGKDISTTFNAWSYNIQGSLKDALLQTGNDIPVNSSETTLPKLILGAGYKENLSKKITMFPELDADMTFDGQRNVVISGNPVSIDPHLGVEFGYDDFIFIRGGVNNIQQVHDLDGSKSTTFQPNMGIGLRLKNLTIDYALANVGDNLHSNVFSLKLDIYKHK